MKYLNEKWLKNGKESEEICLGISLNYSRVEVDADARRRAYSCGRPPQMSWNEADAARSARPKPKRK